MRIIKTIKWLLNHPPVDITQVYIDGISCDYCGRTNNCYNYVDIFCICKYCMKEAFDKVLKHKEKK